MAVFYLDLIAGNNANDGLSAAAPKLSLTNATALVTSVSDEIRVRGTDTLYSNLSGTWTWTNGSNTVRYTGADKTAEIAAGEYICKTTSGLPKLYLVASRSYTGGNTDVILTNTTNCTYRGSTETVATSKLVMSAVIALQTLGRNGQTSGTAASWTRVDTKISGGWDAAYTAQTSYTLIRNTANTSVYSVLNNEATARQYWDMQKFIIFNSNQYFNQYNTYCHYSDCAFINVANGSAARNMINTSTWNIYENCNFYIAAGYAPFVTNTNIKMTGCYFHNSINQATLTAQATSGSWTNCEFAQGNLNALLTVAAQTFTNCTWIFNGGTGIGANVNTNTYDGCTFTFGATAANFSTANSFSNCTYTSASGTLTIGTTTQVIDNSSFNTGSGAISLTMLAYWLSHHSHH